ncbi:FAD-dependent oxidoreductase [Patescibacteria group bacterium]|nr:FAD-dependent oxidoreductase [Patescibacteria group bacterium]MBU1721311.1 FAD-dependent oxidoreductase [Patescibacteria group bacterium]MBU1901741.1 FAD-dependent oxidoreductase [Patescibacteria group bacterium]
MHDLVIIGAAAAGSSAAIYAARRNLDTVIITKDIGGEVALSGSVENWPSVPKINGFELAQLFHKHVQEYKVPTELGLEVTKIEQKENYHIVHAKDLANNEKQWETKAVIIASGIHPRSLGVEGEEELRGKGVTYCTVCDGPLFKGKVTATIGAGNAAVESALMMSEIAKKVYLVTKYGEDAVNGGFPRAENILIEKVRTKKNVEIIYNADTQALLGENMISHIRYTDTTDESSHDIEVNGVMVHVGMVPNSNFVDCPKKLPSGEIEVNNICQTSCTGIFAAGDVTNIPYKQISIAVGHGATAALAAIDYINRWEGK